MQGRGAQRIATIDVGAAGDRVFDLFQIAGLDCLVEIRGRPGVG